MAHKQSPLFLMSLSAEVEKLAMPRSFSGKLASWQGKEKVTIIRPKLIMPVRLSNSELVHSAGLEAS